MEEIVRAFNYVIEKGWVRDLLNRIVLQVAYMRSCKGFVLGNF